ncbi:MAG: hydroxymethylbilane synthase [Actinomycetota bacterium]
MSAPLRVATRGSALARWQAERIVALIGAPAELVVVSTRGDERADVPIHTMGGTGVFVKEVQQAVLDRRADIAVHSAKDLPPGTEPGLVLAAVPERGDARDAIVGRALDDVPTGGRVGTGSVRRRAQLAYARPDLTFGELRGNIPTRLEKAAAFDAVVVAAAGLDRLGLADRIAERLDPAVMLPQVAQGALAVECRADDTATRDLVAAVDDPAARAAVTAERAYLARLGGGCNLPCGALARVAGDGAVELEALLASLDGRIALRASGSGRDPEALGTEVAERLLTEEGGAMLLEDSVLASEIPLTAGKVTPKLEA